VTSSKIIWTDLRHLGLLSKTLKNKAFLKFISRLSISISGSAITNQVCNVIVLWYREPTDLMEIDLLDLACPSKYYVVKMPLELVYT
jgi:hypothetical protein